MKFLRLFFKILILVAICVPVYYGWQEWKKFDILLAGLQGKHPEKHDLMVKEFHDYNFNKAKKLFYELEGMTQNDVNWVRYKKLKKRWTEDKEFQLESMKERHLFRKRENQKKDIIYKKRAETLEHYVKNKTKWLQATWKILEPWEKGEMLREKCVYFLEQEIEDNIEQKNIHRLPRYTALLKKSATMELTPSTLCAKWVPLSQKEITVQASIKRLKEKLSYSYYKEMLTQLGIPVEKTFSFSHRFRRLTAELAG